MNEKVINAKLQYLLEGLAISKNQKTIITNIVTDILKAAIEGITLPEIKIATNSSIGGVKIGYTENAKNYAVKIGEDNKAYVTVPWTDNNTTYNKASSSTDGLMSKEDKAKLDNIANNANNYSLPNATTSTIGGVRQAGTVAALSDSDEITTVISTVNTLIANLKTAGVVANQ